MAAAARLFLRVVLVISALTLAVANFLIAPTQMELIGFAAGNRNPNELARAMNYLAAIASVGVALWIAMEQKLMRQSLAVAALFVATAYLYFLSW